MTDLTPDTNTRIGVVGSETTTGELVVELVGDSRRQSINGHMVVITPQDRDGNTEYALGTVTEITNRNRFHEDPALRGVIALTGSIQGLSGAADIKTARVSIQSAFRRNRTTGRVQPIGGSMTFAADTGEPVYPASKELMDDLAANTTRDLFYLGDSYRQEGVELPLSATDFSGKRGGSFGAFFGGSGTGKTYTATSYIACQLRHTNMGVLIFDPQGQFTTDAKVERELPLDIRMLAARQGRKVHQLSVARQVRLPEDPELLTTLLNEVNFFTANHLIGAGRKGDDVSAMVREWFAEQPHWSDRDPEQLLNEIVTFLMERARSGEIFATIRLGDPDRGEPAMPDDPTKPGNRLYWALGSVLNADEYDNGNRDGAARRKALLKLWNPLIGMFTDTGPAGERTAIDNIITGLCDPDKAGGSARPLYLLSLADTGGASDEEKIVERSLGGTRTQGVIMKMILAALERKARWLYQETNRPANVLVIMDEARRFMSADRRGNDAGGYGLADDIARYFREIRKYAVGFLAILQEPSSLHDSIWKQLSNGFVAFGPGLVGNDLDRVRERVGGTGPIKLYQQIAPPSDVNQKYTFMLCGSISPLSATAAPLFLDVFTSKQRWQNANLRWLPGTFNVEDIWHP